MTTQTYVFREYLRENEKFGDIVSLPFHLGPIFFYIYKSVENLEVYLAPKEFSKFSNYNSSSSDILLFNLNSKSKKIEWFKPLYQALFLSKFWNS